MIYLNLKNVMAENGFTIKELNEKADISRNTLSLMVNGKTNGVQFETLEKLMRVLNCRVDELIVYRPSNFSFKFEKVNNEDVKDKLFFRFIFEDVQGSLMLSFTVARGDGDKDKIVINDYLDKDDGTDISINSIKGMLSIHPNMIDVFSYLFIKFLIKKELFIVDAPIVVLDHSFLTFKNQSNQINQTLVLVNKDGVDPTPLNHYWEEISHAVPIEFLLNEDDFEFNFKFSDVDN